MRFVLLPDGRVDTASGAVQRTDQPEGVLRPKELALLCRLAAEPRVPVARETLYEDVWGYHPGTRSRTLDSTMRSLRKAIEPDPGQPVVVQTAPGVGYIYLPPEPHDAAQEALERGGAEVAAALKAQHLVTIHGPPGSGRTAWLRHVPVPKGLRATWVDLAEESGPVAFARALGVSHVDQVAPMIEAAEPRLWLVDNADADAHLPQLDAWARAVPAHRWVVARRARPPTTHTIAIPPLGRDAARALFQRSCEGQVDADGLLDAVLEHLAGSPGAIVAVARAANVGLRNLLAQLDRGELGEAQVAAPLVRAVGAASQSLPLAQRALFELLRGMRPLPMAVAGRLGPSTELGALVDQGLATLDADRRIGVLPVSRRATTAADRRRLAEVVDSWAQEALHPLAGPLDVAAARTLDGLASTLADLRSSTLPGVHLAALHAAHRSRAPLPASPVLRQHHPAVWAWFLASDVQDGLAALRACDDEVRRSATRARLMRLQGDWTSVTEPEPPPLVSGIDIGLWCLEVAAGHRWALRYDEGARWAARAVRALGEAPLPQAKARSSLADLQLVSGALDAAAGNYARLVESPEPYARLRAWIGRTELALNRREPDAATDSGRRAEELVHRVERHDGAVAALFVGLFWSELGQLESAHKMAQFVLDAAATDPALEPYQAGAHRLLGRFYLESGDLVRARRAYRRAVNEGTPRAAYTRILAGLVSELLGEREEALSVYRANIGQFERGSQGEMLLGMLASVLLGTSASWVQSAWELAERTQEPALEEVARAVEAGSLPAEEAAAALEAVEQDSAGCCFDTRLAVRLTRMRLGLAP